MEKVKVLLITPSNIYKMPYIDNYINLLKKENIKYDIINWDRERIEETSKYTFVLEENKNSFISYLKYTQFIKKHLENNKYDKVIVFSIQLFYFLNKTIAKLKNKIILDIRDDHFIRKYFRFKKSLKRVEYIVLSSKKYESIIPIGKRNKILVNHNLKDIPVNFEILNPTIKDDKIITISSIGSLRDKKINKELILKLKNSKTLTLSYHGDSIIAQDLKDFSTVNEINNISFTGRYYQAEEKELYLKTSMINTLRYPDSYNNRMALPNKLYMAIYYGKPLLAYRGTYLAEIIKNNRLGLVLSNFKNLENDVEEFIKTFDVEEFRRSSKLFLNGCLNENKQTNNKIIEFFKK